MNRGALARAHALHVLTNQLPRVQFPRGLWTGSSRRAAVHRPRPRPCPISLGTSGAEREVGRSENRTETRVGSSHWPTKAHVLARGAPDGTGRWSQSREEARGLDGDEGSEWRMEGEVGSQVSAEPAKRLERRAVLSRLEIPAESSCDV